MSNLPKILIFNLLLCLTLIGCGKGGSDDNNETLQGVFVDSFVVGLSYSTATHSGITNDKGEFSYQAGETVSFSLGNIAFGRVIAASVITPIDLVDGAQDANHPTVTNMIRLLQTLDDDANPENGIVITDSVRSKAAIMTIDFTVSPNEFESDSGVSSLIASTTNTSLVDAAQAKAHFTTTLRNIELKGVAGTWQLTLTRRENDCGDLVGEVDTALTEITQTGNQATITVELDEKKIIPAQFNGKILKVSEFSILDDEGITSASSFNLTLSPDSKRLEGIVSWTWQDTSGSCSGSSDFLLVRRSNNL